MKKFLTLAIHFPTYCGLLKNILKLKLHNVRLGNHVRIKGQFGIKNRGGYLLLEIILYVPVVLWIIPWDEIFEAFFVSNRVLA